MRLIREEKTFIREAVLLMLPMILQNFVTFSMSMADTFMVGVLGGIFNFHRAGKAVFIQNIV